MDTTSTNPPTLDHPAIRRRLLAWYDRNARDLPWRRRPDDPYAQWLAEMMLQQTQAATVIPYYETFLHRYPTVKDLAAADRGEVLGLWAGLGYYRRAHLLHEAARAVANDLDGRFPDTVEGLMQLPGVGRYTAGAIASIAFDRRAPILDGNVKRVLARLLALESPVDDAETVRHLWTVAEAVLPRRRCGAFNQAIMDLGATVCTPRAPSCDRCPLSGTCRALALDRTDRIPAPKRRATVKRLRLVALVVSAGDHVLVHQRPAGGLWGGTWAFPVAEANGDTVTELAERLVPPAVVRRLTSVEPIGQVEHQLTHRLVQFEAVRLGANRVRLPRTFRWLPVQDGRELPTAFRKILQLHRPGG